MADGIDSVFLSSVQTAVGTSVGQGKPLVVYIAGSGDSSWIDSLMSPETLQLIQEKAVGLKLVKDSAECHMFEQVFPNAQAPSVFIVRVQAVLDVIHGDVSKDEFEQRIKRVVELPHPSTAVQPPQEGTPAVSHPEIQQTTPAATATTSTTATIATTQQAQTSTVQAIQAQTQTSQAPTQAKKTLKEQTAELNAKRYRDEQLRLRETQREDRERIRRLLKADEDERKALERERRMSMRHDDVNDGEGDDAIKEFRSNTKKSKTTTGSGAVVCALSLRLLDGCSVQHEFKPTDTLDEVRKWLDENRTDGGAPFAFHRTIPRITYEASDEEKTLKELELTPRSALILKPFNSYTDAYSHTSSTQSGLMSRVWGGISSFWGSNRGNTLEQGQNITQGNPSSASHSNSYEQFRDAGNTQELPLQSPQSSFYASPMHSPVEPELAIGMAHPSALSLNLNIDQDPVPQRARTPQGLRGPQSSSDPLPGPPASLSRMSSNIRTLNDQAQDDRATYNGNHLSLEDDKKKSKKD